MSEMTAISIQKPSFIAANRNVFIAGSVLLFHALAIWALQNGLLMRAVEVIVPVEVLAQMIDLPTPKTAPPIPTPPPMPVKQATVKPTPVTQTAPPILTVNEPAPAATAFVAPTPQPPAPIAQPSVPVAAVASAPPAPAPVKVVLPSSDADYLNNPKPPYPPMSKRLNEQGNVMVRIYIDADGLPQKAELQRTSGFERLDQAALAVVMKWRYVPGKRGGVPEAMWMGTTIKFILE
jgi:periplasmic protein TonB